MLLLLLLYMHYCVLLSVLGPCNQVNCGYGSCVAIEHTSECKCYPGFILVGNICADVNECLQNPCHSSAM